MRLGLGTAAAHSQSAWVRTSALIQFERAAQARATSLRATAFAVLGAAEVLSVHADHAAALKMVTDYAATLSAPNDDAAWPWPEERLSYANAVLAEAMIAAGVALEAPKLWQRGLDLLSWLLDLETSGDHLSPTPVAGRALGEVGPTFDQQPIEVSPRRRVCAGCNGGSGHTVARGRDVRSGMVPGQQRRRRADVGA